MRIADGGLAVEMQNITESRSNSVHGKLKQQLHIDLKTCPAASAYIGEENMLLD